MTAQPSQHRLHEIIRVRRSQIGFRLGTAALIVTLFSSRVSLTALLVWAASYGALHLLELRLLSPDMRLETRRSRAGVLSLLSANAIVFGYSSVLASLAAGDAGLVCGAYVLAGAIMNTVMTTQCCRPALYASMVPFMVYVAASVLIALHLQIPLGMSVGIGLAGLLIVGSALRLWRQGSASLLAKDRVGEDLRRREAEALTQRAFLDAVVENVPSTLVLKDLRDERIVLINKTGERLLQVDRSKVIGTTYGELLSPEQAAAFTLADCEAIASSEPYVTSCAPVATRAGLRWLRTTRVVVRENGEPTYLVALSDDITDEQRSALVLAQALEQAEQASRTKSRFLANMSHEIRTPLNGVLGMAQVMAHDTLPDVQRERLEVVRQSGEALLALLNDLLDISKIESGKIELEETPFDLEAVTRSAFNNLEGQAANKTIRYQLEFHEHARGRYLGDPNRFRQVLLNLISNALKFTSKGGVYVDVVRLDDQVVFSVRDTGIGMSPAHMEELYKPFVQAESSTTRRFGGTGLGLTITKQLVELMGGRVEAASIEGQGSRFRVALPLVRIGEPVAVPPPAPAALRPASDRLEAPALRVLAAEDNTTNQLVLKTLLAQFDMDVTLVADGRAAVAAWETAAWDVILMDVHMPEMDGPTAVRWIRERERKTGRPRTPIIALTADAMTHQVAQYLADGMDGHVAKPINAARLVDVLSYVLRTDEDDCSHDPATSPPDEARFRATA